jgi:hypothetical protein
MTTPTPGDNEVTSRVTAPSPALPYNKKITDRRSRRTGVEMCARSAGAHPTTRLTARQYNGYIEGLTVRCRRDKPLMNPSVDRHRARTAILAVNVACCALVASACGTGPAHPGVARLPAAGSTGSGAPAASGTSKGSGTPASPLAHAECMRSHGVPDFPDPGPIHIDVRAHPDLDPTSPTFVAAQKACVSLEPGGTTGITVSPQLQAAALAYSACMRSHGFPKFSDPVFDSSGEHVSINGIDTESAQFQNADKFCQTSTGLAGLSNRTSTGGAP